MSIKTAILEKNGGNEVDKNEYTNLIMDDMPINEISDTDKAFLEGFTECQFLSLNSTGLKNISNLPKMPKLERLELCDNGIETGCDIIATQYPELRVLKLSGNKLATPDELKHLGQCLHLESLDIQGNPVLDDEAMKPATEKLRPILPPTLDILNNFNKDGQEMLSDEDENEEESDEEDNEEDDATGAAAGEKGREEEGASEEMGESGPEAEDEEGQGGPEGEGAEGEGSGGEDEYGEEESNKRQKLVSGGGELEDPETAKEQQATIAEVA